MNIKKSVGLLLATLILVTSILPVSAADSTTDYYDATIKTGSLGNYNFEVEAHEKPSHETLPIVSKDYFPKTIANFSTEIDNTAPSAVYKAKAITKVDVVFAIGKYSQTSALKNYTETFKSILNQSSNNIDARVQELESSFDSEFALHTTWNTQSDMDTHIRMYSAIGAEVDHIWYGKLSGSACRLDQDDQTGRGGGEWFTIDFPRVPEDIVRMDINIVPYRGNSNTTVSLIDKLTGNVVTSSSMYVGSTVSIGSLVKNGGSWDFVKSNGEVFTGSSAVPLGETLQDVSWRDTAVRFIVNITDEVPKEFVNPNSSDYQYTVIKLMDSGAYIVNVGNSTNRYYLDKLIRDVLGTDGESKGSFVYSGQVSQTFNQVANWIINKVQGMAKPTSYILVNQQMAWETEYKDGERDIPLNFGEHTGVKNSDRADLTFASTYGVSSSLMNKYTDSKILAEKWRYSHKPTYYDNSTVTEAYSKVWIDNPVTVFPNPGEFRVNYKRRDNPIAGTQIADPFDTYRYWSTDYDRRVVNQG